MSPAHNGIMKFEVKTQNDDISKSYTSFFLVFAFLSLIIIFSSISIKLGSISRNYELSYLCRILLVEKTSFNFKKISKVTNQTSKQKIWDLCRDFVK